MPSRPSTAKIIESTIGADTYQFWYCPGCREIHFFKNSLFTFNNNFSFPTFDPGYNWDNKCGGVISLGTIAYDVCNHPLSGTEVTVQALPKWFFNKYSVSEATIVGNHELQTL